MLWRIRLLITHIYSSEPRCVPYAIRCGLPTHMMSRRIHVWGFVMRYWVIEHEQLGVYTGHKWEVVQSHVVWRPIFNNYRTTHRGYRFHSQVRAREIMRRICQLGVVGCKIQGPFNHKHKRENST